jgi:hypothetical protein
VPVSDHRPRRQRRPFLQRKHPGAPNPSTPHLRSPSSGLPSNLVRQIDVFRSKRQEPADGVLELVAVCGFLLRSTPGALFPACGALGLRWRLPRPGQPRWPPSVPTTPAGDDAAGSGPGDATPPKTSPPLSPDGSQTHHPTPETPNRRESRSHHDPGSTGPPASGTRRIAVWSDRSRPHPNSRAQQRATRDPPHTYQQSRKMKPVDMDGSVFAVIG